MESRKRNESRAAVVAGLALTLGLAVACGREGGGASEAAPAPPAINSPASASPTSESPVRPSPVVVRLNGEPITIDGLVGGYPRQTRGERTHAIDNAIQRILTSREARRRGLDTTDAVREKIEALHRQAVAREEVLLRDALQASLTAQVVLTEADLRAHYQQTQVGYTHRRIRLRQAVFDSAEAARAEDQRLGAGGRLDPATSEEIGPAPLDKAMQTRIPGVMGLHEPGQRILMAREGDFVLIELVEELPEATLPFEVVRDEVESDLRSKRGRQAFEKLAQELLAASRVEIVEAVLQDDAEWQQSQFEAAPLRRPWR